MKLKTIILYILVSLILIIVVAILLPNQKNTITTSVTVDAPLDLVYEELLKIDQVDNWFSAVHQAEYVSDIQDAPGCIRECKLEDGSVVQEKMTSALPNESIEMEMILHELPVDYFRWKISTEQAGGSSTQVTQVTEYQVKFGLLGVLLDQLVIKKSLSLTLDRAYLGFKQHTEQL